jgi:hypothetical protein
MVGAGVRIPFMPEMSSDEIQAKALIAAALIQGGHVGMGFTNIELTAPWVESDQLVRLNLLTQRVYDAISGRP